MIEVNEIQEASLEDIINLIVEEGSHSIVIYVPKSTQLYFSTNEDIADDYAMLTYAGELLKESSSSFEYQYIDPQEHESVCFTVHPKTIEQLADALLKISYGYSNEPDDEEYIHLEEVFTCLEELDKKKSSIACPDFYNTYQDFFKAV